MCSYCHIAWKPPALWKSQSEWRERKGLDYTVDDFGLAEGFQNFSPHKVPWKINWNASVIITIATIDKNFM